MINKRGRCKNVNMCITPTCAFSFSGIFWFQNLLTLVYILVFYPTNDQFIGKDKIQNLSKIIKAIKLILEDIYL